MLLLFVLAVVAMFHSEKRWSAVHALLERDKTSEREARSANAPAAPAHTHAQCRLHSPAIVLIYNALIMTDGINLYLLDIVFSCS